jgi:hypothetical protein
MTPQFRHAAVWRGLDAQVEQKTAKTARQKTRLSNFPMRRFAVTA